MRNVLALIGAVTLGFLVAGWYLGWYQISHVPTPQGKQALHVDINPEKIQQDVKTGVEKGTELVDQLREKSKDAPAAADRGPATSFFTPTPAAPAGPSADAGKGSSGGWKPISSDPRN